MRSATRGSASPHRDSADPSCSTSCTAAARRGPNPVRQVEADPVPTRAVSIHRYPGHALVAEPGGQDRQAQPLASWPRPRGPRLRFVDARASDDSTHPARVLRHRNVLAELAGISDLALRDLILDAPALRSGIGGESTLLHIDDTPVFVKRNRSPRTERRSENVMSTANIFDLPAYCHYGVGGPGFGVWREFSTHAITTNWALTRQLDRFPLLHHCAAACSTGSHLLRLPGNTSTSTPPQRSGAVRPSVTDWPRLPERQPALCCSSNMSRTGSTSGSMHRSTSATKPSTRRSPWCTAS